MVFIGSNGEWTFIYTVEALKGRKPPISLSLRYLTPIIYSVEICTDSEGIRVSHLPYFPAHKTHRDFFVRNFRGKKIVMNVF